MTDNMPQKRKLFNSIGLMADIIISLITFLTFISIGMVILCYLQNIKIDYIFMLAPAILTSIFVFVRRFDIPPIFQTVIHILIAAIFVISWAKPLNVIYGNHGATAFTAVSCIFCVFASLLKRYKKANETKTTWDTLVITLVINFFMIGLYKVSGYDHLIKFVTINMTAIITLFFIARQLNVFDEKYFHNMHSSTQPIKEINKQNYVVIFCIIGFIAVSIVLAFLLPKEWITRVLMACTAILRPLLGWMFKDDTSAYEPVDMSKMEMNFDEASPTSHFIQALSTIVLILLAIILFIGIIIFIRTFFKGIKKVQAKITESSAPVTDIIEDIKPKKLRFGSSARDFGHGAEYKIRKRYYKKVRNAINKGAEIKRSSTPKQIELELIKRGDNQITELTKQYEGVRYGQK